MRVLAICAGKAQPIAAKSGRTGHFKTPLAGQVRIESLGVESDEIVDTEHHGGPEQAIYVFGELDRIWWEKDLGRPLPAGFFGENLLIDGLSSSDLALGDTLVAGDVVLQITAPRIPCVTFAARIGDPKGVRRFYDAKRPGAYARVLRRGHVSALDPVTHHVFEGERLPIVEHMDEFQSGFKDPRYLKRLLQTPSHHEGLKIAQQKLEVIDQTVRDD